MASNGRSVLFGQRKAQPDGKLTPQQREEIRDRLADGESAMDLALEYKVSASTVRNYR